MSILTDYLARQGRRGDTELAHVTPQEKALLESLGGAGTINPNTGLREYHVQYDFEKYPWMEGKPQHNYDPAAEESDHYWHESYIKRSYEHAQEPPHNTSSDNTDFPPIMEGITAKADARGWETGKETRDRVHGEYGEAEGWKDYGESDITSKELAEMSEKDRMTYFRDIYKEETDDKSYHAGDYYMRVPDFDESGLEALQTELSDKQTDVYENIKQGSQEGQANLLSLAKSSEASKRRGFASTGNPMIDRQRENIFKGMEKGAKAEYKGYTDLSVDIDDRTGEYYDDYMEDWETAGMSWIDAVNV